MQAVWRAESQADNSTMVSKELVLSFQSVVNARDSSTRERESCFALDRRQPGSRRGRPPVTPPKQAGAGRSSLTRLCPKHNSLFMKGARVYKPTRGP